MRLYIITTYTEVNNSIKENIQPLCYTDNLYQRYAKFADLQLEYKGSDKVEKVPICDIVGNEDDIYMDVGFDSVPKLQQCLDNIITTHICQNYPNNRLDGLYNMRDDDVNLSLWVYGVLNYTGGTTNSSVSINHNAYIDSLVKDILQKEKSISVNPIEEIYVFMHNRDFSSEGSDRVIDKGEIDTENKLKYKYVWEYDGVPVKYFAFSHVKEGIGGLISTFQESEKDFNLSVWAKEINARIENLGIPLNLKQETGNYYSPKKSQ